jgi:hypothetical protein
MDVIIQKSGMSQLVGTKTDRLGSAVAGSDDGPRRPFVREASFYFKNGQPHAAQNCFRRKVRSAAGRSGHRYVLPAVWINQSAIARARQDEMVVPHSELFVFLCPAPPSPAISRMFRQKRANPVWARLFVSIGVHQAATTELRQCSRFATRAKICCRSRRRDFTLPFFHHKLSMLRQPSWRNWMKYFNLFVAFTLWLELVGAASSVANGAELSTEYRGAHPPRVQHRAAAAITACGLRCRTTCPDGYSCSPLYGGVRMPYGSPAYWARYTASGWTPY